MSTLGLGPRPELVSPLVRTFPVSVKFEATWLPEPSVFWRMPTVPAVGVPAALELTYTHDDPFHRQIDCVVPPPVEHVAPFASVTPAVVFSGGDTGSVATVYHEIPLPPPPVMLVHVEHTPLAAPPTIAVQFR